ncbi:MAG: hypothetical protein ABSF64_27960 [Bryobacteraceae bacterium]|jgi:hypothetical protein
MTAPKPLDYSYTDALPGWDHSIVLPPIVQALRSIPSDGAVLDMGCGNGAMLAESGNWDRGSCVESTAPNPPSR